MVRFIVPEEHGIFGLVVDPELKKAHSRLEFVVRFPEMDKMTAQGNIIFRDAERNLTHRHAGSPWGVILHPWRVAMTLYPRRECLDFDTRLKAVAVTGKATRSVPPRLGWQGVWTEGN
jgi:hypothetical protein